MGMSEEMNEWDYMVSKIEQLQARVSELEAENARLRTVPMKYRRMAFNAQLQDENNELQAKIAELEEENARLKVMEESALKVCGQLDEVVIALPYDYLDPPDGGDVSLGEQVKRMYSEVKTLRRAVVASQAYAEQLLEALRKLIEFELLDSGASNADELCFEFREAVKVYNIPRDTSALDAFVAERVKEARCTAEYWKAEHVAGNE